MSSSAGEIATDKENDGYCRKYHQDGNSELCREGNGSP